MSSPAYHFDESYRETLTLKDGTAVILRMVRPSDKALLLDGFDRLSPESRFRRFFGPKVHLSDRELRYLTELDGETHFAVGALRRRPDGSEQGVAVARFVRLPQEPDVAEPAVAVVDEMQGKGLGAALLVRLNAAAQERGVARFRCHVLACNPTMLGLIRKLDPAVMQQREDDLVRVDFEVPKRPWDVGARSRPRGRALHGALAMAAEGALTVKRVFSWLDAGDGSKSRDT